MTHVFLNENLYKDFWENYYEFIWYFIKSFYSYRCILQERGVTLFISFFVCLFVNYVQRNKPIF